MRSGIISVLYKKKDRSDPRNYRPLTLLNNDYKILMRILTQRMNEAVLQFVSRDQNGFVPDGFIAENILRLQLLQELAEEENIDALFIFLDMEKAFDRCSWEFLQDALAAVGFGKDFIDYVSLAYSHTTPPTRQIYVNGFLGPSFPLGSGVAQGCPLSPLLFLIIAEPLTRLFNQNRNIYGIVFTAGKKTYRHKISQFADDSTLILRTADIAEALRTLQIWCDATSMKENETKREILLLGLLRRHPELLGNSVVPSPLDPTTITRDGTTIRALGVPIGNDFDLEDWWLQRYRTVKPRAAAWNGLARLSLTGRNILLQSILYGSMRYWFFTLIVPDKIIDLIEQDAKALLWAANPELHSNEDGTAKRSNRYMTEMASYLPQKEGGGSIMHLRSHIKAYQAQWVIKYLDPRRAPWKEVLDHWILHDDTPLGRGILLSQSRDGHKSRIDHLPDTCTFIRACFQSFHELQVSQDTTLLTHESIGEPLWRNNRSAIGLDRAFAQEWTDHIYTYRVSDLVCPSGLLTANQWDNTIIRYASYSRKSDAWIDERQRERPIIIGDIPTAFKRAIDAPAPPFKDGDIVLAVDKAMHTERYARYQASTDGGPDTLTELWTDTTGYPHETGKTLRIADQKDITHVALWTGINKHYKQPFAGDDDETPEERAAIIGPVTSAFPLCDGWHTLDQTVRKKTRDHPPRRLSDLSIHEMTTIFTARITRDVRPNCEANWTSRWYRPIDSLN